MAADLDVMAVDIDVIKLVRLSPCCHCFCFGPTHLQPANAKPGLNLYSAGDAHSAALTSNGFLFMWGSNEKGQLGLPAAADVAAQASVRPSPVP